MTKQISSHAQAAKMIRQELKRNGIKGKVKAKTYSGGDSVHVTLDGMVAPWVRKAVTSFCNRFQGGHFDGMTDMYTYNSAKVDHPTVKYVFVSHSPTDADHQAAWEWVTTTANFVDAEGLPRDYKEAQHMKCGQEWVSDMVWRVISGTLKVYNSETNFWQKPRLAA